MAEHTIVLTEKAEAGLVFAVESGSTLDGIVNAHFENLADQATVKAGVTSYETWLKVKDVSEVKAATEKAVADAKAAEAAAEAAKEPPFGG